jgi:SAM-dependent methyltransferase
MKILDVGAEINPNSDRGLQLIDSYSWKNNIYVVNILPEHVLCIKKRYPQVNAVVGDACKLPWPDKYFDIVYSNAVIEHVGDFTRQRQMASEIMRVGKRWFVSTPNRWYPFEFHLRLPFVTWFPGEAYLSAARVVRYNHARGKYTFGNCRANFRLMTTKELKICFPNSRVIKNRVTFMAETLIAIGGDIKWK